MTASYFRVVALAAASGALGLAACAPSSSEVARGQYLVNVIGCSDCHTPGGLSPHPDLGRYLAGSEAEFDMPGLGVFNPPNLTPDMKTGIGSWSEDQIAAAITTGVTPSGRILSPAMPWTDFSHLTHTDALAIAAYLKSLPAVVNVIPGPGAAKPAPDGTMEDIVVRHP